MAERRLPAHPDGRRASHVVGMTHHRETAELILGTAQGGRARRGPTIPESNEQHRRLGHMPTISTKDGAEIFYQDWGAGQPVVLSHGWPLNADAWDGQAVPVADAGYRAIAHDRRGHERST